MAKTRALLTETEREQLAGEHGRERKYQATSRVRRRIDEELVTDVAVLEHYHPDLLDELRAAVCPGHGDDTADSDEGGRWDHLLDDRDSGEGN